MSITVKISDPKFAVLQAFGSIFSRNSSSGCKSEIKSWIKIGISFKFEHKFRGTGLVLLILTRFPFFSYDFLLFSTHFSGCFHAHTPLTPRLKDKFVPVHKTKRQMRSNIRRFTKLSVSSKTRFAIFVRKGITFDRNGIGSRLSQPLEHTKLSRSHVELCFNEPKIHQKQL